MKRAFSLFLVSALIVAFLVPFSFAVPVYADTAGRELQYIKSTGTQYIDTGYIPNQNTRIVCKAIVPNTSGTNWLFGSRQSSSSNLFTFAWSANGCFVAGYNTGTQKFSTSWNTEDDITIDFNANICTLTTDAGTTSVTLSAGNFICPVNLTLFAGNTNGSLIKGSATVYSFQVYDNGTLLLDLVPWMHSDGRIGMLNKVNGTFYANAGSGTFEYAELDSSNGNVVIDGQTLPPLPDVSHTDGTALSYWAMVSDGNGNISVYFSAGPFVYGTFQTNYDSTKTGLFYGFSSGTTGYRASSSLSNGSWTSPSVYKFSNYRSYINVSSTYSIVAASDTIYTSSGEVYFTNTILPTVPVLETSFDGQVVYISKDERFNVFINAENINGSPTYDWYVIQKQSDGSWSPGEIAYSGEMAKYAPGCYIGGWEYIPDVDSAPYTIMLYAVVTNEFGGATATAQTGVVLLHVTLTDGETDDPYEPTVPDSGGDSETLGKLEGIETDIQEVQQAVANVSDKVDHVSDLLEGVEDQMEESNNKLGQIVEDIKSLPERIMDGIKGLFVPDAESMAEQQEKWNQLLSDRFGAVYEAGEITNEIAAAFSLQDVKDTITFPTVTVPLGEVDWTFGGWEVDVVPDGLEFLIDILKKIIDIVCTFAFINAMKNRFDRTLEAH